MLIPEKETAEVVSNVAAVFSVTPSLTGVCGATSIGTAAYAGNLERLDGNYHQAGLDIAPTIAAETTGFILKRATMATDAVSNAIGVAAGLKSQYWIKRDNYIDHEGDCQHAEE